MLCVGTTDTLGGFLMRPFAGFGDALVVGAIPMRSWVWRMEDEGAVGMCLERGARCAGTRLDGCLWICVGWFCDEVARRWFR